MTNCELSKAQAEERYRQRRTLTAEQIQQVMNEIQLCQDVMASVAAEMRSVNEERDDLGNREAVNRDAQVAYDTSAKEQDLFIGNRQFVSGLARGSEATKILNVPNWSWGLNVSWVEGGISAKAHFALKLTDEDPFCDIPEVVKDAMNDDKSMSHEHFLELCKQHGSGSLLWYDLDGADRPTWTALEIACLLRAGYSFHFGDVITLLPPA